MKVLTVINGVVNQELADRIDRYACLSGFCFCHARDFPGSSQFPVGDLMITDREGTKAYGKLLQKVYEEGNPVILIPVSPGDTDIVSRCRKYMTIHMIYPFTYRDFVLTAERCFGREKLQKRDLEYGGLKIDREKRVIYYQDREALLGPYEFTVLVYMLEHMGKAVSRQEINGILPKRKRESQRNVDTHMKNIRKCLGMQDVIVSVRSIGYRIDPDRFYDWMRN